MSDALLSSLVASLSAKQLPAAKKRDVKAAKEEALAAERLVDAVRAASDLDKLPKVPRELLDTTNVMAEPVATALMQQSELGRRRQNPGRETSLVQSEASRYRVVTQLAVSFAKLAGERLGRKWHGVFAQWLFGRRQDCEGGDCIVPASQSGSLTRADLQLRRELMAAGVEERTADAICLELSALPSRLQSRMQRPPEGVVKVKVSKSKERDGLLRLTWQGVHVDVNSDHYNKLRVLYAHARAARGQAASDSGAFLRAAMAVLLRYCSLQGTHHLGGQFQAALHAEVFDALQDGFQTCMECFASPLNCRWPRYCSAFVDTDAPFGSLGSFFSFHPAKGSFEVNPPFDHLVVQRAVDHIGALLSATADALMFVVIVPCWEGLPCWEALLRSPFNRHHLRLDPQAHGFFEGSQHNSATRYRAATTATSVVFLQTAAAKRRWPVTPAKLAALTAAFATKAHAQRRRPETALDRGSDALLAADMSAPMRADDGVHPGTDGGSAGLAGAAASACTEDDDLGVDADAGVDALGAGHEPSSEAAAGTANRQQRRHAGPRKHGAGEKQVTAAPQGRCSDVKRKRGRSAGGPLELPATKIAGGSGPNGVRKLKTSARSRSKRVS